MNDYLISVIVPVYNVEDYLDECIQSLINQTYTNLEIILVDDGSPDRSPQMCDEWAQKDHRIKVIHKANGGLSSARNAGLDVAQADFISFVDSDDFFDSMMYERLYEGITMFPNIGISAIQFYEYKDGNVTIYNELWNHKDIKIIKSKDFYHKTLVQEICHAATNKLYKRDVLNNIKFREGRLNEDVLFMFDLSKRIEILGYDMIDLPYNAYYYRMRDGSICHSGSSLYLPVIDNLDIIHKESDSVEKKVIANKMKNYQIYSFCLYMCRNKKNDSYTYEKYFETYFSILQKMNYRDIYWRRFTDIINFIRLEFFKKMPSVYRLLY